MDFTRCTILIVAASFRGAGTMPLGRPLIGRAVRAGGADWPARTVRSIARPRAIPSTRQNLAREGTSSVASVFSELPRTRGPRART